MFAVLTVSLLLHPHAVHAGRDTEALNKVVAKEHSAYLTPSGRVGHTKRESQKAKPEVTQPEDTHNGYYFEDTDMHASKIKNVVGRVTQEANDAGTKAQKVFKDGPPPAPVVDVVPGRGISGQGAGKNTILVSYGQGEKWREAGQQLADQALNSGHFTGAKIFSEVPKSVLNTRRWDMHLNDTANGWWFWKPVIIYEELHAIQDGDVLVYIDAGCEMSKGPWKHLLSLTGDAPVDVFAYSLGGNLEKIWTKADIFKHFQTNANSRYGNSAQISASIVAVRKSPAAMQFIGKWIDLAADLQLISNWASCSPEVHEFEQSRNDQSLLSMLMKVNYWNDSSQGRSEFLINNLKVNIFQNLNVPVSDYGPKYHNIHGEPHRDTVDRRPKPRPAWAFRCV